MDSTEQVTFITGLLERFSPTWSETPAVEYMADWMKQQGYRVQIDEAGSVIGSLGDGPREILLLGHIDTVAGIVPVRQENDLLYGRGAVDAKGPLACFAIAGAICKVQPGWKITVIGAVGEEGDSRGAKLVRDRMRPDCCIIGEPSGWDHITLGYKGSAWFEYTVTRPLTHTAGQAESACEAAVQFWNRFQAAAADFNNGRTRAFDQLTTSLREMKSSEDGFSQSASLVFNLRLPPDLSVAQVNQMIENIRGDGKLVQTDGIECYRGEKNSALVRAFLSAIREENGKPGFLVKTGTSDMNIVGPVWNVPILAYGPGDSNLDHTPQEHVSIEEFLTGIRVLTRVLEILQQ
ncbi:MAG: [LysW]-lysine hydrolase [Anaerolineaceae bacterium]|nr:[LysW]-lysine hydrolase [Anaerolineaceae bacterium]